MCKVIQSAFIRVSIIAGVMVPCVYAEQDVEALREEIATQRELLKKQAERLEAQAAQLERLEKLVNDVTRPTPNVRPAPAPPSPPEYSPAKSATKSGLAAHPFDYSTPEITGVDSVIPKTDTKEILDEAPIAGLGRGEEFTDGDFLKSVPLFGSDWRFSFGGYAKVDLIYDFSGSGDPSQFLISQIPVDGVPQPGSYSEFQYRETRFNFEVRNSAPGAPESKFFTEFDFFGGANSSNPRVRHAYFQYGNLLVGQTWTTLTELRALPLFIDFGAGDSLFGGRTVQVRWEQEIDSQFDWAIALEDFGDTGISNPSMLSGTPRSDFPTLAGRIGYNWDHGLIMLGGSVGENRWDGVGLVSDESVLRWNIATGGRIYLDEDNTHYFGFGASYGEGTPRQIITFGNAGTPNAVLDPTGNLVNVTSWNANVGLHLKLSEKFSSNLGFAYAQLGSTGLLAPASIQNGWAAHANLMYDFNEQIRAGIELMLGKQELVNGRTGTAQRLQTGIFYYF